jgi:hypothetical protein
MQSLDWTARSPNPLKAFHEDDGPWEITTTPTAVSVQDSWLKFIQPGVFKGVASLLDSFPAANRIEGQSDKDTSFTE